MQIDSSCPDRRTLRDFLMGNVPEDEAAEVERHLEACASCSETAQAERPTDAFVGVLRASASSVTERTPVDPGLLNRLRQIGHDGTDATEERARDGDDFLAPAESAGELGRFRQYRVIRRLGRGGMGIVYLARQERPARVIALKVLAGAPVTAGQRLARFRTETDLLGALKHANIVQVYEAGEHAGLPYYTMEYLEGGSLAQRLAESPLAPRDAATLVKTIAEAIQLAHDRHIVHRDLKPSNVLLAADGAPKVSDFGLAKYLEAGDQGNGHETETGAILGTPGYMAPEQSAGGDVGPWIDIYALGAILYETLTGRPPFKGATLLDTLQQARSEDPVPPGRLQRGLPRDLQAVCLKCLEKNPQRRYATAGDLAADLGRFLGGEPTRARPLGVLGRSVKWARRRPALAGLTALGLLAAVAATAGIIVHNRQLYREVQRAAASEARAERQEERTAVNYAAARNALNRILDQLKASSSADIPRLKELRRKVLEETLAFYETAVGDESELQPAMLYDLAVAYRRISQIQWMLADWRAARRNGQKSLRLSEKLVALDPQNADYEDCLATDCIAVASFMMESRPVPEAERIRLFRKAIDIYEQLRQRQPENPVWRQSLATAYHDLAGVSYDAQRFAEARSLYTTAINIRRSAIEQRPEEATYRVALAEDELSLGLAEAHLRHAGAAEQAYREADRLLKELIRANPHDDAYLGALGALWVNRAALSAGQGDIRRCLSLLGEGIERLEPVLAREPSDQVMRERLINLYGTRAEALESLRRFGEAIPDWDRVVALENRPGLTGVRRLGLANALARTGAHKKATEELSKVAAMPDARGDLLYDVACIYSVSADAANADAHAAPAARTELADRYGRQAVESLKKLRTAGYFADRKHVDFLKQDADLRGLRTRSDFQKLLEQISGR